MLRLLATISCLALPLAAQTIQPPFAGVYGYTDLGSVPGVPGPYGGVTFKANDNNRLLIGGSANGGAGAIYEIQVARSTTGEITGFVGTATLFAAAPNIDGGLAYGPGGVLFYTTYSNNTLGQITPGGTGPAKVIQLANFGVTGSTGALGFVPPGFPGAGELKIASYNTGVFLGFNLTPDGTGTFDLVPSNGPVQIGGGPEGILYVPPGSALIQDFSSVLVTEYGNGAVALYQIDSVGNPIPASRFPFLTGLGGAEGACTDPVTGALMFSTFGGGNRVVVVEGFGVCGSFTGYGNGVAGATGVPTVQGGGCAGRGQVANIDIANALPNGIGVLAVGYAQQTLPLPAGQLLVAPIGTFFHFLDGTGAFRLQVFLPIDPVMTGLNLFAQSFYSDPAGPAGYSATAGLHIQVR
ncbi:MAG: hypothetical protein RL398_2844 [Planctomycetota bacterium]|jgi:hypothetical protein